MGQAKRRAEEIKKLKENSTSSYFEKQKELVSNITKQQLIKPKFDGDLSVLSQDELNHLKSHLNINSHNLYYLENRHDLLVEMEKSFIPMAIKTSTDIELRNQYHFNQNIEKNILELIRSKQNLPIRECYVDVVSKQNFTNTIQEAVSKYKLFETHLIALAKDINTNKNTVIRNPLLSFVNIFYSVNNNCYEVLNFPTLVLHHFEYAENNFDKFIEFVISFFELLANNEFTNKYSSLDVINYYREKLNIKTI